MRMIVQHTRRQIDIVAYDMHRLAEKNTCRQVNRLKLNCPILPSALAHWQVEPCPIRAHSLMDVLPRTRKSLIPECQCHGLTRSGRRCAITSTTSMTDSLSGKLVAEPLRRGGASLLIPLSVLLLPRDQHQRLRHCVPGLRDHRA